MQEKNQNIIARERNITLDFVKGIAILLVVYGHFIQTSMIGTETYYDNPAFKAIYSFHMPLFALVNGYLFFGSLKKRSLKELLISRITGLLVPIIIWSLINWMLSCLQHRIISISLLWDTIKGNLWWFLWSVFAAQLVISVVEKLFPEKLKWVGYIIGFFVMYVFPNPELNLFLYPYILTGFLFSKKDCKLAKVGIRKWCIIPLWIILLLFFNRDCYIYTSGISLWNSGLDIGRHVLIDFYRYVIGFAGSLSIILIVLKLEGLLSTVRSLAAWGENSMHIYIMQCFMMKMYSMGLSYAVARLGKNPVTSNSMLFSILISPIMALLLCTVLYWASLQIKKLTWLNRLCFGR